MADRMTFPDTLDEFLAQYQFKDSEEIYTNGAMLIPVFRVKQWVEHAEDLREMEGDSNVPDTNVGDMISRQAAIDALCDNCDHAQAICPHYPCKQYLKIEKLPSAQRWIPCSERLPEESKWYLISNGLGSWEAIWSKENKEWLSVTALDCIVTDVIAWMEFPEPYGASTDMSLGTDNSEPHVEREPITGERNRYHGELDVRNGKLTIYGSDRCVCCGAVVPEGRMVCPVCERRAERGNSD